MLGTLDDQAEEGKRPSYFLRGPSTGVKSRNQESGARISHQN